jgi:hypothetical protein
MFWEQQTKDTFIDRDMSCTRLDYDSLSRYILFLFVYMYADNHIALLCKDQWKMNVLKRATSFTFSREIRHLLLFFVFCFAIVLFLHSKSEVNKLLIVVYSSTDDS